VINFSISFLLRLVASSLRSKCSPQHFVHNDPQTISFLKLADQVSQPHDTTGKGTVLYILNIYVFRKETGRQNILY
jgi:hypothetical protein